MYLSSYSGLTERPDKSNPKFNLAFRLTKRHIEFKARVFIGGKDMFRKNGTAISFVLMALFSACSSSPPNNKPTLSIASPSNNTTLSTNSIIVTGVAADEKGLTNIQYTLNGGARANATGTSNWSFIASNLATGNNVISVIAIDTDAAETIATVNVNYNNTPAPIDATPPTVTFSNPTNNAIVQTATVDMTGLASDNTGVSLVQVSVNNATRVSATGTSAWSSPAALNCGANTITAFAKDAANNEGTSSVTVTRDCGSFALAPVYPSGQTSYPVAQGSDVLYTLTLTPTTPFNTAANALSSLTATGTNIGTGANQMRVFYQPTLSSGNQVGVVFKAGSSLPLGLQTVTLQANAGGVSASVTVNINVLPCSSGC
jgi:hypothetical protein